MDFTWDSKNYSDLKAFVAELNAQNLSYVPVLNAGIAKKTGYDAYDSGVAKDVFIKNFEGSDDYFTGMAKAGFVVYPDFLNDDSHAWWTDLLDKFQKDIGFDGLWLSKNEPSNLCDGVCLNEDGP